MLQWAEAESGGLMQPGGGKAVKGALTAAASCGFVVKLQLWLSWEVPVDRMRSNGT